MTVRYSSGLATVMLAIGGIDLFLALVLMSMGSQAVVGVLVPGAVCALIGIGYLTRPYFSVDGEKIVLKALIGPLKREFVYTDRQLILRENKVFLTTATGTKKLPLSRWIANKEDWKRFLGFCRLV